jgi:hypothetical protein
MMAYTFINMKCVVGTGGSQTRTLREVYWFVESQLNIVKTNQHIFFANILDGDEAYRTLSKFEYLLNLPEYESIKKKVYVGDLKNYVKWFYSVVR